MRLARKLAHNAGITAVLLTVLMAGAVETPYGGASAYPETDGSASAIFAAHDCWTGDQPDHVTEAGHVIVTIDGDVQATYGGRRLVKKAVEQALFGLDRGMTVHAFCA